MLILVSTLPPLLAVPPCTIRKRGQILGSTVINNKLTHSVTLMPVVRDLVRNAELSMEDIGLFCSGERSALSRDFV